MKKLQEVFFSKENEKGLNETSASHLCAVASQYKDEAEAQLRNVSFVNSTMNVVGAAGAPMQTAQGIDEIKVINQSIAICSRMNSFISWFAEARKNLEEYKTYRLRMPIEEWANEVGVTLPEYPEKKKDLPDYTMNDVIQEMNIKDRLTYLSLEAKSSVLGKSIHPGQPFEEAYRRIHDISKKPFEEKGSGRDTLIYHHTPSLKIEVVDAEFQALQAEYRETEAKLNHMKSDLRNRLTQLNLEVNNTNRMNGQEFSDKLREYNQEYSKILSDYNEWLIKESTRLSKIKFRIPEDLEDVYKFLQNLQNKK